MSYDNASAALEDRSVSAEAPRKNRDEFRAEKVATVSGRVGPDFGKIEALAVLPNRTMCGTKPSQIGQPRSSRSPEGNCNHKQVWRDEAAPKVGALPHVSRPDRRQQECDTPPRIFALSRLPVMPSPGPADVSSFLPFLNTERGRDAEMTSPVSIAASSMLCEFRHCARRPIWGDERERA